MGRGGAGPDCHFPLCSDGGQGQSGLIGCLAVSPAQELFCCGSYGRSLGLYPMGGGGPVALWPHLPMAPTHLRFSPDGVLLYAGGRKVGGATGPGGRGRRVSGANGDEWSMGESGV